MQIKSITDPSFKKYGRILDIKLPKTIDNLKKTDDSDGVIYFASENILENTDEFTLLRDSVFGGMPIQIGYCNGVNNTLNALEYHRDSEINITGTEAIFMLGLQSDISDDFTYDTSNVEIFKAEPDMAIEFYATTLHYAPCSVDKKQFKVAVVLPKGTNTEKPNVMDNYTENKLMTNKNKWLIAHKDANINGAFVGLTGENIKI